MTDENTARGKSSLTAYVVLTIVLAILRWLPRDLSRRLGILLARAVLRLVPRWRGYAETSLQIAFPGMTRREREKVLQGAVRNWGRQLAEFARFPRYNRANIESVIEYDGLEHYRQAIERGKGVLFLTAHLGGWELSCFAHAVNGYPLAFLNRPLDDWRINRLLLGYRALAGNFPIDRRNAARAVLEQLKKGGAVGILFDQNVLEDDASVFADFFGVPASTTSGLARFALKTDAAVVPGFAVWDGRKQKYRLEFEPAVELCRTGNHESDVAENTARFNQVVEKFVRRYPDQWLWVHRRWRTRPPGDPPLYES